MSKGLKISISGNDVKAATPEQCIVHSDYLSPKIRANASPDHFEYFTHTFGSNPASNTTVNLKTVAHGYSYTPLAIVYWREETFSTGFRVLPWGYAAATSSVIYYTDGTNFKIDFIRGADAVEDLTGLSFDFKYYIFAESGA